MKKILVFVLLGFGLICTHCDILDVFFPDNCTQRTLDAVTFVDAEAGDSHQFDIDPFSIDKVEISGDTLKLKVTFAGGCRTHKFSLYASKYIYKSSPPQSDIWLSHNANGDNCEALITQWLHFDMSPLTILDYDAIYLRIYQYGEPNPIQPMPLLEF